MKIGICILTYMGVDNYGALVSIAPKAEEVGFDSVWVSEHLFNMGYIGARIGGRPYYEAMTVLTHVAAMTSQDTSGDLGPYPAIPQPGATGQGGGHIGRDLPREGGAWPGRGPDG